MKDLFCGKYSIWLVGFFLCLVFAWASVLSASEVIFLTHNLKKQVFVGNDGRLHGKAHAGVRAFHIELVYEMMEKVGHSTGKILEFPFKRGLSTVQNQPGYALFNVARTPEREKIAKWVGPIIVFKNYFWEARKSPTGVTTMEDARALRVTVMRGGDHDQFLTRTGFSDLIRLGAYSQCFQMLLSGRSDLTVSSVIMFKQRANAAGLSFDDFQNTGVIMSEGSGYIMFSKNISDEEIKKWQDALDEVKKTDRFDELAQKYLIP